MRITESRLRRIIRSVIAENLDALGPAPSVTVEFESNYKEMRSGNACDKTIFNYCISDARRGGILKIDVNERFEDISYEGSNWVSKDGSTTQNWTPSDSIYRHLDRYRDEFSDPVENETIKFEVSKSTENGNLTWTFKTKDFYDSFMFKVSLINTEETYAEGAWRLVCVYVDMEREKRKLTRRYN